MAESYWVLKSEVEISNFPFLVWYLLHASQWITSCAQSFFTEFLLFNWSNEVQWVNPMTSEKNFHYGVIFEGTADNTCRVRRFVNWPWSAAQTWVASALCHATYQFTKFLTVEHKAIQLVYLCSFLSNTQVYKVKKMVRNCNKIANKVVLFIKQLIYHSMAMGNLNKSKETTQTATTAP